MKRTVLALSIACCGCDADEASKPQPTAGDKTATIAKADAPKANAKAATPKPAPAKAAPEPEAPQKGVVVLEAVELEGLGKIKMPKGYESSHAKGWRYDLGDDRSISVSWEPYGARNLKEAKKLSKVLANAPTVKTAETLENGDHEIERVRDSDGFTFIAMFADKWYVKCVAPEAAMEHCREIVRSKT